MSPARQYTTTLTSPGQEADWILDNVADSEGNIYVAGYTTGNLDGKQGNKAMETSSLTKYTNDLKSLRDVAVGYSAVGRPS